MKLKSDPISRELKFGTFTYDPKSKLFDLFLIDKKTGENRHAKMDVVYALSFVRFCLRIIQSGRHKK